MSHSVTKDSACAGLTPPPLRSALLPLKLRGCIVKGATAAACRTMRAQLASHRLTLHCDGRGACAHGVELGGEGARGNALLGHSGAAGDSTQRWQLAVCRSVCATVRG